MVLYKKALEHTCNVVFTLGILKTEVVFIIIEYFLFTLDVIWNFSPEVNGGIVFLLGNGTGARMATETILI